jgi:hypothetical protein
VSNLFVLAGRREPRDLTLGAQFEKYTERNCLVPDGYAWMVTWCEQEALDRIKWRNRFGTGCGPVV